MPQKHGPGCGCCGCKVAFDDRFTRSDSATIDNGWTEVDSVWEISSNNAVTSSAGKMVHAQTDADGRYVVVADFEIPTVGDKARVIVGYLDANNYAYAEVEYVTSAATDQVRLRTYQVQGGVHTLLDVGPNTGPAQFPSAGNTIPTIRVQVCWRADEKRIAAAFFQGVVSGTPIDEDFVYTEADAPFLDRCFAVAASGTYGDDIGIEAAVVGSQVKCKFVKVYDLRTDLNDNEECPSCNTGCHYCIDGYAANTFSVAVAGDATVPGGTYLFPTSFVTGGCGGSTSAGPFWVMALDFQEQGPGIPEYRVRFEANNGGNLYRWATAWSTTKLDCRNFSSTPLTPVVGAFTPNGTCTITSV